jgi:hypothetical protein
MGAKLYGRIHPATPSKDVKRSLLLLDFVAGVLVAMSVTVPRQIAASTYILKSRRIQLRAKMILRYV